MSSFFVISPQTVHIFAITQNSPLLVDFVDDNNDGEFELVRGTLEVEITEEKSYYFNFAASWNDTDIEFEYDSEHKDLTVAIHTVTILHDGLAYFLEDREGYVRFEFGFGECEDNICSITQRDDIELYVNSSDFQSPRTNINHQSLEINELHDQNGKIEFLEIDGEITSEDTRRIRIEIEIFDNSTGTKDSVFRESEDETVQMGTFQFNYIISTDILWALNFTGEIYIQISLREDGGDGLHTVDNVIIAYQLNYVDIKTPGIIFGSPLIQDERTVDFNSDGLYDQLIVEVNFEITAKSDYYVEADLWSNEGRWLGAYYHTFEVSDQDVSAGSLSVPLIFGAGKINERGDNGSYTIDLDIRNFNRDFIQRKSQQLGEYSHTDFVGHGVVFNGYPSNALKLRDTDADGFYDWYDFTFEVNISQFGNYSAYILFGLQSKKDGSTFTSTFQRFISEIYEFDVGTQEIQFSSPARQLIWDTSANLTVYELGIYDYSQDYYYFLDTDENFLHDESIKIEEVDGLSDIGLTGNPGDSYNYTVSIESNYNLIYKTNLDNVITELNSIIGNITISTELYDFGFPLPFFVDNRTSLYDNSFYYSDRIDPQSINVGDWYQMNSIIFDDYSFGYVQITGKDYLIHQNQNISVWTGHSGNFKLYFEQNSGVLIKMESVNSKFLKLLTSTNLMFPDYSQNLTETEKTTTGIDTQTSSTDGSSTRQSFLGKSTPYIVFWIVILVPQIKKRRK